MSHFRGFIAVPVPVSNLMKTLHDELAQSTVNIKLVELENIHITVKFLGETKEEDIPQITEFMHQAVEKMKPFSIQLRGTGVFPKRDYIKVIWIGIHHAEPFSHIASSLNNSLTTVGFKKEKKGFKAHLTIGRMKSAKGKERLLKIIDQYQETFFDTVTVDSLRLMKSTLTPQGPIYKQVKKIKI